MERTIAIVAAVCEGGQLAWVPVELGQQWKREAERVVGGRTELLKPRSALGILTVGEGLRCVALAAAERAELWPRAMNIGASLLVGTEEIVLGPVVVTAIDVEGGGELVGLDRHKALRVASDFNNTRCELVPVDAWQGEAMRVTGRRPVDPLSPARRAATA